MPLEPELRGILGMGAEGLPAPAAQLRAVGAVLCVEVLRACGLAAGVREAAAWLGGGARPAPALTLEAARAVCAGSAPGVGPGAPGCSLAARARARERQWLPCAVPARLALLPQPCMQALLDMEPASPQVQPVGPHKPKSTRSKVVCAQARGAWAAQRRRGRARTRASRSSRATARGRRPRPRGARRRSRRAPARSSPRGGSCRCGWTRAACMRSPSGCAWPHSGF